MHYLALPVNVQFNSLTGIFSLAGFLLIYARICTTTVAAIFALQAYLPDHVINFLGDVMEPTRLAAWQILLKKYLLEEVAISDILRNENRSS